MSDESEHDNSLKKQRQESREILRPMIIFGVAMILLALANAGFSVWMSATAQKDWCKILDTVTSAPAVQEPPPSPQVRAYEAELAKEFRDLKVEFRC